MRITTIPTATLAWLAGALATPATAQTVAAPRTVTFQTTGLTEQHPRLQQGIKNYVTLSMLDVATSRTMRIDEPPEFPLIATLQYRDHDGVEREVATEYAYRC
ncbi:MAG: hypothetical protein KAI24_14060 [Planctomycetes bacterium]|nr:hypothetical protein [Planctomycetota bacterium]